MALGDILIYHQTGVVLPKHLYGFPETQEAFNALSAGRFPVLHHGIKPSHIVLDDGFMDEKHLPYYPAYKHPKLIDYGLALTNAPADWEAYHHRHNMGLDTRFNAPVSIASLRTAGGEQY